MDLLRPIAPSYRAAAVAVAVSAAIHGAALVGVRGSPEEGVRLDAPAYTASLESDVMADRAPAPGTNADSVPRPLPRARKSAPLPNETVALLPAAIEAADLPSLVAEAPPMPEMLALAQPAALSVAPAISIFPAEALPGEVSIAYALTSAFADGEAEYNWKREGDRYEITGSARASGFFAIFLEGSIEQSASGRVTPEGLRPGQFSERRGSTPEEGLSFDWDSRVVEFRRGDERRTGVLTDSTVDWLSMIFQLAHVPPTGESMELRVYTQRRLHQYSLQVVGNETLELPFGRAQTLHLRHTGGKSDEAVDVWLGVEQYYLPVKLRYPIARNRLVVEQTATSIKAR